MFLSLSSIHSELAKAGRTELQTRVEQTARERDATLTRAQEMSDRLVEVKQEKHNLQVCVGPGSTAGLRGGGGGGVCVSIQGTCTACALASVLSHRGVKLSDYIL